MITQRTVVIVVDDDPSLLKSVARLLAHHGIDSHTFASAEALLENDGVQTATCCSKTLYRSHHGSGHETTDVDLQRLAERPIVEGPDHRATSAVRLLDNGLVRYVPPLALDAHAVVAVPHLPVGVGQRRAVGVGTA
jgi:DNA-binding NtrC family response regulator